jgi:hypothetical protein
MATYEELINEYESRRKSAERKVSDSKARAKDYIQALDAAGIVNATADQEKLAENLMAKHRAAIDEVKHAEGALNTPTGFRDLHGWLVCRW